MARIKGDIPFSGNFELQKSAPLDAFFCPTLVDLLDPIQQEAHDGLAYMYYGKKGIVFADPDPTKNGVYFLIDPTNPQLEASWAIATGGGDSGAGVYIEDVILGTTEGSKVIQHDLGTYNLHISAYILPLYEKADVYVRQMTSNSVQVEGFGDNETVKFIIGSGGSSSFANATPFTRAESETMVSNEQLVAGNWYELTDFQTINHAGFGIINTGSIEPLYLLASSKNTFARSVYSKLHFDEIIYYDWNDSVIPGNSADGEWQNGANQGGSLTITNVTTNTFEISTDIALTSNFFMEVEDSTNYYAFAVGSEGDTFTKEDLGSTTRITINKTIDLTDGVYNYIFIQANESLGDRPGAINYRKNTKANIETELDFRGVQFARRKVNSGAITTFIPGSGITYNFKDMVLYLNKVYVCLDTCVDQNPSTNSQYWVCIADNADHNYLFSEDTNYARAIIPLLSVSEKLFPVFGTFDLATETPTFSLAYVSRVNIKSDNVICVSTNGSSIKDLTVEVDSEGSTFAGNIDQFNIDIGSKGSISLYEANILHSKTSGAQKRQIYRRLEEAYIEGSYESVYQTCRFSNFGKSSYGGLFNDLYRCDVEAGYSNFRLGSANGTTIGRSAQESYIRRSTEDTIGKFMINIHSHSQAFMTNRIGNRWQNFLIPESVFGFYDNVFGNRVGPNSGTFTVVQRWRRMTLGSNVFNNNLSHLGAFSEDCYIGDSCYDINIGQACLRTHFGARNYELNFPSGTNDCTFGVYTRKIDIAGWMHNVRIGSNVMEITTTNAAPFQNVLIHDNISWLDFGGAETLVHGNYLTEIMNRQDGIKVLKYIDATNVVQVVDPTT